MDLTEKLEPVFIFGAVILGLLFHNVEILKQISPSLITIFLALMLFALFLDVPLDDIAKSFSNLKFTSTSLIINFIWTPLLGIFLGKLFLSANLDLLIGFIMLLLTPCTDWYLVFTKMAKGNLPLSLSILPINLVLQLILLPVYLLLFFSSTNTIQLMNLTNSIFTFIIMPFILANIIKYLLKDRVILDRITDGFSKCQLLFLCIAIFGLFNTQAESLMNNLDSVGILFIPIILFFIINAILDYVISWKLDFTYEEYASLTFTTLARNSPLALAIAISSFPHNQLIAIGLVIGPLIELPILYIVTRITLRIRENY